MFHLEVPLAESTRPRAANRSGRAPRTVQWPLHKKVRRHKPATVVAPATTFLLGIIATHAFGNWLTLGKYADLGLFVLAAFVGVIVILVAAQLRWQSADHTSVMTAIEAQAQTTGEILDRLARSSSLAVDYIDDSGVGASYRRAAELIRTASVSITFVDFWEPYENYQADTMAANADETSLARKEYYDAIRESMTRHAPSSSTFHRRVIQVPQHLLQGNIPFSTDPIFRDHLNVAIEQQLLNPVACKVRLSPSLIRLPFVIIDQHMIVMPVLSQDAVARRQTRYGALFFEDREGSLYACLKRMYQVIESRSRPLANSDIA